MLSKQQKSLAVSGLGLLSNTYGLYTLLATIPPLGMRGGHFQFLTNLGLFAATCAFAVKVIRFFSPGSFNGLHNGLVAIATPAEGLISALYWPMVLYNRDLLIPKDSVFDLPLVLDLSLHFWPAVLLYLDFFLLNVTFRRSSKDVVTIYSLTTLYFFWTWYCFSHNGIWPYPFLSLFSDLGRGIFFLCCGTLCVLMYEGGAYVHSKLHPLAKKMA